MKLSLISRVIVGFTALLLIFTAITLYSLTVEKTLSEQLELASGTLGSLLDDTNRLRGRIQDANRAVTQHANSANDERREELASLFTQASQQYQSLSADLHERLADYPRIKERLQRQDTVAGAIFQQSQAHLKLQNERIEARRTAVSQAEAFDNEWIFFEGDLNAVSSTASARGDGELTWEIDFIIQQAQGAQAYLQRALGITTTARIAEIETQLNNILQQIKSKGEAIQENFPAYVRDVMPHIELLIHAAEAEDGLFQSHKHYVQLNERSEQMLLELDSKMDNSMNTLEGIISATRALTNTARQTARETASTAQTVTLTMLLAAIALSLLICFSVVTSIRKPLARTLATLHRLAEGDLTGRIEKISHDEIGRIATNVNDLADRLTALISQIRSSSDTMADVAQQSSQVSHEAQLSVEQQQEQTSSVATAITEMESAVHEVAGNAERTSSEVSQVTQAAEANMASMKTNIRYTTDLSDAQHKATMVIQELSDESQQIGTILDVIQAIAEQTNLLALNAAIEAARAGEQGRGFAVVADEVRTLANRSQQSATDIRGMIERLREKAGNAVEIMASNRKLAEASADQSKSTGESLAEMVKSLAGINDMSHSIATASEEQSAVAQEVTQNVVRISDMADDLAETARKASTNSERLQELATEQRQLVGRFRLE